MGLLLLANLLAILLSNRYPIPAAHAVPALLLDVALSPDSIYALLLSAAVVDALYFFLTIPVQLSCLVHAIDLIWRRSVKGSS